MTHEEKETPDAATPGVTVKLTSEKQFTAKEIDDLLAEVITGSTKVNVKTADKCLKSDNRGSVVLVQPDSKLKKILDRVQFLRLSKILNLLRHRGI